MKHNTNVNYFIQDRKTPLVLSKQNPSLVLAFSGLLKEFILTIINSSLTGSESKELMNIFSMRLLKLMKISNDSC